MKNIHINYYGLSSNWKKDKDKDNRRKSKTRQNEKRPLKEKSNKVEIKMNAISDKSTTAR